MSTMQMAKCCSADCSSHTLSMSYTSGINGEFIAVKQCSKCIKKSTELVSTVQSQKEFAVENLEVEVFFVKTCEVSASVQNSTEAAPTGDDVEDHCKVKNKGKGELDQVKAVMEMLISKVAGCETGNVGKVDTVIDIEEEKVSISSRVSKEVHEFSVQYIHTKYGKELLRLQNITTAIGDYNTITNRFSGKVLFEKVRENIVYRDQIRKFNEMNVDRFMYDGILVDGQRRNGTAIKLNLTPSRISMDNILIAIEVNRRGTVKPVFLDERKNVIYQGSFQELIDINTVDALQDFSSDDLIRIDDMYMEWLLPVVRKVKTKVKAEKEIKVNLSLKMKLKNVVLDQVVPESSKKARISKSVITPLIKKEKKLLTKTEKFNANDSKIINKKLLEAEKKLLNEQLDNQRRSEKAQKDQDISNKKIKELKEQLAETKKSIKPTAVIMPPSTLNNLNSDQSETNTPAAYTPPASYSPAIGYPSAGYPPASYPSCYPSGAYPPALYPSGYPPIGYPPANYPPANYPSAGFPSIGYPPANYANAYPPVSANYPPANYPPSNYLPSNYPPSNYPPSNYPSAHYPSAGYPPRY